MIKKIKRWYENLLSYQKITLFTNILSIFILILWIIADLFGYFPTFGYIQSGRNIIGLFVDSFVFIFGGPLFIFSIGNKIAMYKELSYKKYLKKNGKIALE